MKNGIRLGMLGFCLFTLTANAEETLKTPAKATPAVLTPTVVTKAAETPEEKAIKKASQAQAKLVAEESLRLQQIKTDLAETIEAAQRLEIVNRLETAKHLKAFDEL